MFAICQHFYFIVVGMFSRIGDFTWRVSDCEELVGLLGVSLTCEELVGGQSQEMVGVGFFSFSKFLL